MQTKITYENIPLHCDSVRLNSGSVVVLSKRQATLYKKLIDRQLKPLDGFAYYIDLIYYTLLLAVVFLFARNLFLLAHFHHQDSKGLSEIVFKNNFNNEVEILFESKNSKRESRGQLA